MSTSGLLRTEIAPDYWNHDGCTSTAAPLSVQLEQDEEVEWTWSYYGNGAKRVTGYTIIKKPKQL
jgi:hypothetical protein